MVGTRVARRAVHVLLGAVVLLPYLAAGWVLVRTGTEAGAAVGWSLGVPAAAAGAAVLVLPGVRELATTAARALLDVPLPDPPVRSLPGARRRAAAWIVLGAAAGAVGAAAVLWLLPTAVALVQAPWVARPPLPTGPGAWWAVPAGVLLVPVAVAVPAVIGAGQARLAPRFLGPGREERLAVELARARDRAERQAGRARLARELHDSVGHALTVTTLQAGAAAELLDADPAFVRRALTAIADTGRAALDELDHVLGVLHDDETDRTAVVRDLDALDGLLDGARAAGLDLVADVDTAAGVPATVSREAYRVVQEGLTNALRHGTPGRAHLALRRTGDGVGIELVNPAAAGGRGRSGGGRGLAGAGARVDLLGGTLTAGPDDGRWVLRARLPCGPPPVAPSPIGRRGGAGTRRRAG
ncbi:histidine kinase [Pseudonocardia sp. ICBG1034]|uniref:sensor histidine kinase n=1 Tax=Pseudonocardia sp. ICBG1034 TaxID=2844381 RepID=UPI001CCA734C|nr:histidine kinase [Pseudonocardia sp. ICBG1034]